MRLNNKNQGWAYSKGRLWSQVWAGSLSRVANGYFFQAEGSLLGTAEGSLLTPAEGSLLTPAEGSLFVAAESSSSNSTAGSLPYPITHSLSFSNQGLSRYRIGGCWLLAHLHKLKGLLQSGLMGWVVLIAQLSLPAYSEQTDDAAIHSQLDRLHQMASQANFDAYFALYAPDAVFIGTDAGERWTISEFKAYAEPHFSAGRGWTYQTIERHIMGDGMGDGAVRWFDELLWNEKLGPCRGSGVMVKVGDEWLVSHYLLSLAVPNEIASEVGGQSIDIEKARRPKPPSNR